MAVPRRITINLGGLADMILVAATEGVNMTGARMYAHAKKHAPERQIYKYGGRDLGGGRWSGHGRIRGRRQLSPEEMNAESEIRTKLGLNPAIGVMTRGMPMSEKTRQPRSMTGLNPATRPVLPRSARRGPSTDMYNPRLPTRGMEKEGPRVPSPLGRGTLPGPKVEGDYYEFDDETTSPYRAVRQTAHTGDGPAGAFVRGGGVLKGGALRALEVRKGLPHGSLGKYELEDGPILAHHLSARGLYEMGVKRKRHPSGGVYYDPHTALQAGRAVNIGHGGAGLQVGGRLKREISAHEAQPGPLMEYTVSSPTPYAKYVEFGTRHAAAQPYLRPAVGIVRERFRRDVMSAVKRYARGSHVRARVVMR